MEVDLLAGSCIYTWKKLIKVKAICPLTFFFKKLFSDTITYFKSSPWSCSIKKGVSESFGICTEKFESLFNKIAGLQDCCKTYLLHSHLRFYFSLGKAWKSSINFPYWKICQVKSISATKSIHYQWNAVLTCFSIDKPLYGLHPHIFTRKSWSPLLWFFKNPNPLQIRGFTLWILHTILWNSPNCEIDEGYI